MRKLVFAFALLLVGCGGAGIQSTKGDEGDLPAVLHVPEIADLTLSPTVVEYGAGDGETTITADLTFSDSGGDVQSVWIELPDGSRLEFHASPNATTGTLTEQVAVPTGGVGPLTFEVWIVDEAGDSSNHLSAEVALVSDVAAPDWTNRSGELPYVLNDVVFTGTNFVAVGGSGKILTSADGIEWVTRDSHTEAELTAVASQGSDVVAVGREAMVLLSNDDGASWTTVHSWAHVRLAAVTLTSSEILTGGMDETTGNVFLRRSVDGGGSWSALDSWPRPDHFVTDLAYADGVYVAGTGAFDNDWTSDGCVMVSAEDGSWTEIAVQAAADAPFSAAAIERLWHDGTRFLAAGPESALFVSENGQDWTALQVPVDRVAYLSAAWDGSKLLVAGGITWWYWWVGTPDFTRPVGLSSTNGGATWEPFDIDGYYQSRGMAWGAGRFVSVGQSTPASGLGAIYTTE